MLKSFLYKDIYKKRNILLNCVQTHYCTTKEITFQVHFYIIPNLIKLYSNTPM